MEKKKIDWARMNMMLLGNVFLGVGIALFKLSGLGNDPFSGMVMALAECVGIVYANFLILINLGFFVIQFVFGRKMIGAGTLINALFLGYIVTFFYEIFLGMLGSPEEMWKRVLLVCVGVIVGSFGLSMYQQPNMGVAPYDSMSLIINQRWPRISYFWSRMFTDALCAVVCFLAGGIVGLGTLVCAFGFGPVVHFFNVNFTNRVLRRVDRRKGK